MSSISNINNNSSYIHTSIENSNYSENERDTSPEERFFFLHVAAEERDYDEKASEVHNTEESSKQANLYHADEELLHQNIKESAEEDNACSNTEKYAADESLNMEDLESPSSQSSRFSKEEDRSFGTHHKKQM